VRNLLFAAESSQAWDGKGRFIIRFNSLCGMTSPRALRIGVCERQT